MKIINHIKYDIEKRGVPPVIDAVQGEVDSRVVELSVFSNGSPVIFEESVFSLAFQKPDGKSGWYTTLPDGSNAYSVNGNVISMTLAPQVLTTPGQVNAVIRIEPLTGYGRITTFPFFINVSEDPANNAPSSENYYAVQNWDDINQKFNDVFEQMNSSKTLFVTWNPRDPSNHNASHNAIDVQNHIAKGGQVVFSYGSNLIPLTYFGEDDSAYFEKYDPYERIKFSYRLYDDYSVEEHFDYLASNDWVYDQINDALGDIETALDGILAIQKELIGGDA